MGLTKKQQVPNKFITRLIYIELDQGDLLGIILPNDFSFRVLLFKDFNLNFHFLNSLLKKVIVNKVSKEFI